MITKENILEYNTYKVALKQTDQDPYINSPFSVFKNMSSRRKGAAFERIFEEYMVDLGADVQKPVNSEHDRIVNGVKVEIKGSTLWGEGSHFRFQQIRANQDYDIIVFISVFPDRIEFHCADKETAMKKLQIQDEEGNWVHNQHGGKTKNSGTFFIDCFPNEVDWMDRLEEQIV
jgi:hypothetical protein